MADQPKKLFSEEQLARYKTVFALFDINKNGTIQSKELESVAKVLGYRLKSQNITDIASKFNLGADDSLTFEQFVQAFPGNDELIAEEEHNRAEYRGKFQEYDKNGDGFVSKDEAQQVLQKALGFTEEKTKVLISQFDVNADGKLSYEDFVVFFIKVKEKKAKMAESFREFDKDNKGFVSMDDARRILTDFCFEEAEIVKLVQAHDANKDGKLQYGEFVNFWGT